MRLEKGKSTKVTNKEVVEEIHKRQEDPDLKSGYHRMTFALMLMGYVINHKKTYRLMKENQLLLPKSKGKDKTYAKYRTVCPTQPLEVFGMDIKLVYCSQKKRYAQIFTIIDTFTRVAIYREVNFKMKKEQIIRAWENVIERIIQPSVSNPQEIHIEIRSDNGPQFIAKDLRSFFEKNGLIHVFAHPYTPQENAHIESFHAILSNSIDSLDFSTIEELEERLNIFYENYNNSRIHSSIANLTPILFWRLWDNNFIERKVKSKRKVKFYLKGKYQQLPGNTSQAGAPCQSLNELAHSTQENQKVDEQQWPITLMSNLRYKTSPGIAPCQSKSSEEFCIFENAS